VPPPQKLPDDEAEQRRQTDLAQKSEAMSRELSQKREMRIRQDRVRHIGDEPFDKVSDSSGDKPRRTTKPPTAKTPVVEDRTLPSDTKKLPREPSWERRPPNMLDDVASELEELMRDLRQGWRVWHAADKITFMSALLTLIGTLLPWVTDKTHPFQIGLVAGGVIHAGLACAAIALLVGRARSTVDARGLRVSARELSRKERRASLWHLLIGALSTFLCAYLLVVYGFQRSAQTQLEIRFGLYVTLAAGMGLSYGGFSRFWSRHE
jgi:hypothetical protein